VPPGAIGLEDRYREQVHDIDRMLGALDVWTVWASGQSVAIADLTDVAELLAESASWAPLLAAHGAELERSR
jgi:hypothetical protein